MKLIFVLIFTIPNIYTMYLTIYYKIPGFIKSVEEHMDPHDAKIIGMFTLFQLIFTILALIPTPLMFNYERINAIYLVMLTGAAIWNGGRFYIQVFSQRYNSKFMPRRSSIAPKTE